MPHDGTAPNRGAFARVNLRVYSAMNTICSDQQSPFSAMDFFLSFKFCRNVIAMCFIVDQSVPCRKATVLRAFEQRFIKGDLKMPAVNRKLWPLVSCVASVRFGLGFLPCFGIKSVISGVNADVHQYLIKPKVNELAYG